jgi:S-DNA-T family DNA segregation ATPase FtsK/SpoIIIE
LPDPKSRRLEEVLALLYGAGAAVSGLALGSYHAFDPSLNCASSSGPVQNLIGLAGSYASDLLLQLLGLTAFLLPLLLAAASWRHWSARKGGNAPPRGWIRAVGVLLLASSLATAFALPSRFGYGWRWQGTVAPGGLAGNLLAGGALELLNLTGTLVSIVLVLLASLYLLTAFSLAGVSGWFGWAGRLGEKWAGWREERRKARLRAKLEKLRAQGRPVVSQVANQAPAIAAGRLAGGSVRATPGAEAASAQVRDEGPEGAKLLSHDDIEHVPVRLLEPVAGHRAAPAQPRRAGSFRLPSVDLLREPDPAEAIDEDDLRRLAAALKAKCDEFDVIGAVTQINPGPVVTTYEFKPEAGIKYNRVTNLVDDLCLALQAESILIERIPGKSTVGIEVPNPRRSTIYLREVIQSLEFTSSPARLTMALGKDINGRIRTVDLGAMPHLLIAGATGTGKSVAINCFIVSLLYKYTPAQVRLILVDPKRLELGLYEGVPHLMTPIITEPKLAANALRNAVKEMERRLKLLAEKGVRNIEQYNRLFETPTSLSLFEENKDEGPLPYIVIIIDELADLMMVDSRNVEESITRLAQMARAGGIHLILATQRPSVDVLTGLIKANLPARISFRVATKVDSRTVLDSNGAEALLGKGDMLYLPPGSARLHRVHGALVTEKEITCVVDFWRMQSKPEYDTQYLLSPEPEEGESEPADDFEGEQDPMYQEAVRTIVEAGKASTSILQRRLRLGYGRAARLLDMMQRDGIISPPDGPRPREVLKRPDWFAEVDETLR